MASTDNVLVFSSILFLVVIELSLQFRSLDLEKKARSEVGGIPYLPNLGVFSLTHSLNTFLLTSGYLMAFAASMSEFTTTNFVLWVMYLVLLVTLPYLEIEDYDKHLSKHPRPNSYSPHLLLSAFAGLLFPVVAMILAIASSPVPTTIIGVVYSLALGVCLVFGVPVFLKNLRTELREDEV